MSDVLNAIRSWMAQDTIDVLLFPYNDQFQSEYLPAHDQRLAWISDFTGSSGFAIITADTAALFVNGIYSLQASIQVDPLAWTIVETVNQSPIDWLDTRLQPDQVVALEDWRFTVNGLQQWQKIVTKRKAVLRQINGDIADTLWTDRPTPTQNPAFVHDLKYAGKDVADKIADVQAFLERDNLEGYVITDPGHICWLLNIRGHDIAFNPLLLSMAFIARNGAITLFTDPDKIGADVLEHFGNRVTVFAFDKIQTALIDQPAHTIGLDPGHAPAALAQNLKAAGKIVQPIPSPLEMMRALKNEAEIDGARQAHTRDAVAVIETHHWIQTHSNPTSITELAIIAYMTERRRALDLYVEDGFDTIAGVGAHGAIIHYRATPDSNANVQMDTLLLIDSSGQYRDGTTDITRTLAIGTPTPEMIADYTSVLQGHIAVDQARFPSHTFGGALDILARHALWQRGRNYNHGTGHGIGSFMCVHEGPQRISPGNTIMLQPGMLVTNEPGYYKAGSYGIRLENVVLVVERPQPGDEQPMLGFESLTCVPFDSRLIDFTVLTRSETDWLRTYHQFVLDRVLPHLQPALQAWLRDQCAPFLKP